MIDRHVRLQNDEKSENLQKAPKTGVSFNACTKDFFNAPKFNGFRKRSFFVLQVAKKHKKARPKASRLL
jgi:hypothetical protein